MLETIIVVLLLLKYRQYNIRESLKDWSIILVLITVVFYIGFQVIIFTNHYELLKYQNIIKILIITPYFIMATKNQIYKNLGFSLILVFIGSLLNTLVMNANGGKMPIFPSLTIATTYTDLDMIGKYGDFHVLGGFTTKLIPLSDIFDIGYRIASVGDVLVSIAMGLLLYNSIKKRGKIYESMV